ncbi:hypothetical protein K501DRAFT_287864 [Backusella circina FSU 941]|nr:hypothetical protein K501DRAFT_287864 [Backusella circina FSU 941]
MLNTSRRFSTLEYSHYQPSRYDHSKDDKASHEVHQKVAQIRSRSRSICTVPIAEPTSTPKKNQQSHHHQPSSFMALTASSKAKSKQNGKSAEIPISRKEPTLSSSVTSKLKKAASVRNIAADSPISRKTSLSTSTARRVSSRPSSIIIPQQQQKRPNTHDHAYRTSMTLAQSKAASARTVTQTCIESKKPSSIKSQDNKIPSTIKRKKECCPTDDADGIGNDDENATHECASPVTINFFESDSDEDELFETSKYKQQEQIKKKTSQSAIQSRRQSVSTHDTSTKSDVWEELNDLRDRLDTLEIATSSNKTSPAVASLEYHDSNDSPPPPLPTPVESPISYPNRQLKKAFEQFQTVLSQQNNPNVYSMEENVSKRIITDAFAKVVSDTIHINQSIWQSIPQDLNMNAPALIELQKNSDMQVSALADAFLEMSKLSYHQHQQQNDIPPDYMYSHHHHHHHHQQQQQQQQQYHHQQQQQQQQQPQYTYRKSTQLQSPPLQPRHSAYLESSSSYSQKRHSNPYLHFSATQYMPESSSSSSNNYHHVDRRYNQPPPPIKSPPLGYPRNIRVAGILKPKSPSNNHRSSRHYPYQDEILYGGGDESSGSDYQDYYPLTPPSRPFESNNTYRPYIPCPP